MILTPHLVLGAAIASKIGYIPLAIILALLSHYFLDLIPHMEYSINNIQEKQWRKSLPDFLRVFLDFFIGILLLLIFSNNQPMVFVGAFLGILPDGFSFLNYILPKSMNNMSQKFIVILNKFLKTHSYIHQEKIHFLKHKKISSFWRTLSQILAIIVSLLLLKY